ncbi:ATP-binding protein [Bdellovibrionota bacterium FG-2]
MPNQESTDDLISRRVRLLVQGCAVFVSGLGVAALLGWSLGLPFLANFGSGNVPMAPSTALLFTLLGGTLFLCVGARGRGSHWICVLVHGLLALFVLILVGFSIAGVHPQFEHLGFSIPPHRPGAEISGHMSLLTALCFLLSSVSFLLIYLKAYEKSFRASGRTNAAWSLSVLVLIISLVLVLAYLFGMPLLYGTSFTPPALPSSIAFVVIGAALFVLTRGDDWLLFRQGETPQGSLGLFWRIFVILTVGILIAGSLIVRAYGRHYRLQIERELTAIADLKVAELVQWRSERVGDAELLYGNATFISLAQSYFKNPRGREVAQDIRDWLSKYLNHYEYDQVWLLDPKGETVMSFPHNSPPDPVAVLKQIPEVTQTKRIMILDFYRHDYDQRIYLSVLIPLLDSSPRSRVIGIVALRIDPEKYLYPFILRWPTPSETAETLLVRREGREGDGAALFLNELKYRKNSALSLRIPLTRTDVPAVMAVLGQTGIVEGVDYREMPAIASLRNVPDSPWFLVARMNTSEVYSPSKLYLWPTLGFVLALIFGSGSFLAFAWRKRSFDFYAKQLEAAETIRLQSEIAKNLAEGVNLIRFSDGVIVYCNPKFEQMFGYAPGELLGKDISIVNAPREKSPEDTKHEIVSILRATGEWHGEVENIKKDGTRFWCHANSSVFEHSEFGEVIVSVQTDISVRKRAEADLLAAKNAAELAAKSKAQFLDIAAHELRNPVTAFSLLLQMVQKQMEKGQPPSVETLVRLREPADRLTRLVVDLLDVSRLERGLVALLRTRCDLASLISKCVEEFRLLAPKRQLAFNKPVQPIVVDIDPVRIYQVLTNLIDNSIKYTPAEGAIEVTLESLPSVIRVAVVDQGGGIPEEQLRKLFIAFSRGSGEAIVRANGLGLGLSVCRGIIELHGGTIGVLSTLGQGSMFYFDLPKDLAKEGASS